MLLIPKTWYLLKILSDCVKIVWLSSGTRLLQKKKKTTNPPISPDPSLPPQKATYSQRLWLSHSHTAKFEFTHVSILCICETQPRAPVFQWRRMCRGSWVFRITQQTNLLQTGKEAELLPGHFCNKVLSHHGLSKMTMKERMLPVSKWRAIRLTLSNSLEDTPNSRRSWSCLWHYIL